MRAVLAALRRWWHDIVIADAEESADYDRRELHAEGYPYCGCQTHCGDVPERADHPLAVCRGLPS